MFKWTENAPLFWGFFFLLTVHSSVSLTVTASKPLSHFEPPSRAISQPFNNSGSQLHRQQANQSNSGKQVWEGLWIKHPLAAQDMSHTHQSGRGRKRDRQRCMEEGEIPIKG